ATGKSAVGRALSQRTGARFVDLDARIEERAGKSIAQIFQDEGEPHFRALEQDLLLFELQLALSRPTVISLGGGALVDRDVRILALSQAIVVTLSAQPETIARRAADQDATSGARPLLRGADPLVKINALLAERRLAYRESHGQISTDALSIEQVTDLVSAVWARDEVAVAAGEDSYNVGIGSALIAQRLAEVVKKPSGTLLVTDTNVAPLHGDRARTPLLTVGGLTTEVVLTPGEENKNIACLSAIYQSAFDSGLDRSST